MTGSTTKVASLSDSSIVLQDAATDEHGSKRFLIFHRTDPYNTPTFFTRVARSQSSSTLPSITLPTEPYLNASITEHIGPGSVGITWDIAFTSALNEECPRFVAKFSHGLWLPLHSAASRLFKEAAMYEDEHVKKMQGIVLPHYFGLWTAVLPAGWRFSPWNIGVRRQDCRESPESEVVHISFIILEKLGPKITRQDVDAVHNGGPFQTRLRIARAYTELAFLGLDMEEIEGKNIHHAPSYPGALKSRPSLQLTLYNFRFTGLHKGELTKVQLWFASCVRTILDRFGGDDVLKADEGVEDGELEKKLWDMSANLREEDAEYEELVPQWLGDA